jgi:type IV pilus assembly protein PilQ
MRIYLFGLLLVLCHVTVAAVYDPFAVAEASPMVVQDFVLKYRLPSDIAKLLRPLPWLKGQEEAVLADDRSHLLSVTLQRKDLKQLKRLILNCDRVQDEILIKARIVFVDTNYEHQLGLLFSTPVGDGVSQQDLFLDLPALASGGANVVKLSAANDLDVALAAMQEHGRGKVISKPSLTTVDGVEALIQTGEEIPYQETTKSGATSVRFKSAVLRLRVVPEVMPNNRVLLHLQLNQDKPSSHEVLGVPAITTREIKTQVLVQSGGTAVIGGIYEDVVTHGVQSVPGLSRVPLLGALFRYKKKANSQQELLIFVTPSVIKMADKKHA